MARIAATPNTNRNPILGNVRVNPNPNVGTVTRPRVAATPTYTKSTINRAPARTPARVNTPVYRAPEKRTPQYAARTSTSSSGGGGGSSGGGGSDTGGGGGGFDPGGGGGGFGGGDISSFSMPVFQDITIPDALEDTDYKRTVADLARALGDLDAQQKLSRTQYDTGYGEAKRRMGWNADKKAFDRDMPGAYGDAVYANENDFAGRGLTWSGLFGKSFADLGQEFADRAKNLDTARQDNLDTQALARTTFVNSQEASRDLAKQNAISKIMAQFGIGASEVPTGTGSKVIQRQVV